MARTLGSLGGLACAALFLLSCDPAMVDSDGGAGDASSDAGGARDAAARDGGGVTPARILLIIADDLGVDTTAVYADIDGDGTPDDGRTYAPMPNVTQVCQAGVRFTNAYAAPTCSPTRASVLTGRYGFRTGVGWALEATAGIEPTEVTLPQVLDGLATANIGKWHLGTTAELGRTSAPNTMGWDHYAGTLGGGLPSYDAWSRTENGVSEAETRYATSANVDDAVAWLGGLEPDQPWLLWLAFNAPHNPLHLPPSSLHSDTGLSGTEADIGARPADYYRAMVEAMDTEIGRLLSWLRDNGQEDVHVIFMGDNGTTPMAVEAPQLGSRSKGTLYENGIHVPLCIAGPSVDAPGRTSGVLTHVVDLFSTIVDLAGGAVPADVTLDSVSLAPVLSGVSDEREHVYAEAFGSPNSDGRVARGARFKLLAFADGREELYDLQEDPLETTDLLAAGSPSGDAAEAYARLAAYLASRVP